MKLQIQTIKIDELNPAPYNPRRWSEDAVEQLKESINRFGVVDPILVNDAPGRDNVVIGGHFRIKVAKDLGFTELPVVYVTIPELEREKERHGKAEKEVEELESWSREASVSLGRLTEQLAAEESRHAELRADCERLEKMAATPDQRRAIKDLAEVIRAARARSGVIMSSAEALATAKERYEQRHTRTVHRPAPTPAPRDFDAPKG